MCSEGGFLTQDGGCRDKGGIHWPRNGKHFQLKTEKLQPVEVMQKGHGLAYDSTLEKSHALK